MSQIVITRDVSELLAMLSLITWAATLFTVALAGARRARPGSSASVLLDDVRGVALWLAFVVALVATLGSLYLSQIAHFHPCPLCWAQRACMYPLTVVLLLGAVRPGLRVWHYALPSALVGATVAAYHAQLQAFPAQAHACTLGHDSCLTRWVWEFGFVSIPFMSLAAFAFIITMLVLVRADPAGRAPREPTTHFEEPGRRARLA